MSESLSFERVETGREHTVTGHGSAPITDAAGNPEAEYVLFAVIDGVKVPLQSFSAGRIDSLKEAAQRQQERESSEQTTGQE